MRITVKQQIILAPAAILLLLILLLGFMQYTYRDLAEKRREASRIDITHSALAEADMSARRLHLLLRTMQVKGMAAPEDLALITDLYQHLVSAINRIEPFGPLKDSSQLKEIQHLAQNLNPVDSPEPGETAELFARFRAHLSALSNITQIYRNKLRLDHERGISQTVQQVTSVSMAILILAIITGACLSTYTSRRLLDRIQTLSRNAARIADGNLELPEAPARIRDELDGLTLSISRMSTRLINVIGTEKLLEGAEEERRRIAMDLHDQSLADLSTILRGLQSLDIPPAMKNISNEVKKLEQELEHAITNLRDIMNNLHPQTLDILGLGAAIESHLEQHCHHGNLPEYHFYLDSRVNELPLDRTRQLSLYRIALEAIHNVIKHAAASRYEVTLEMRDQLLILAVEDNGRGIETSGQHQGRGLNNIRERARAMGADVQWTASRFSSGTRFELTLLCQQDNGHEYGSS